MSTRGPNEGDEVAQTAGNRFPNHTPQIRRFALTTARKNHLITTAFERVFKRSNHLTLLARKLASEWFSNTRLRPAHFPNPCLRICFKFLPFLPICCA
jgi:hypothetical protein